MTFCYYEVVRGATPCTEETLVVPFRFYTTESASACADAIGEIIECSLQIRRIFICHPPN